MTSHDSTRCVSAVSGQAFSIRPARLEEQAFLEALQLRASLANPGDQEMLRANPGVVVLPREQIESGLVFVAEGSGADRVGFAALLRPADSSEIELDGLFVEPAHWQKGAGRALVEYCAAFARELGAKRLNVIANLHAVGFYQRCGFHQTGPYATPFGPALRMTREL